MYTLEELRKQIEQTDAYIIEKLAIRQELAKQIGEIKSRNGTKIVDRAREEQLFHYYAELSHHYHLQQEFVNRLFKIIIANSKKVQK